MSEHAGSFYVSTAENHVLEEQAPDNIDPTKYGNHQTENKTDDIEQSRSVDQCTDADKDLRDPGNDRNEQQDDLYDPVQFPEGLINGHGASPFVRFWRLDLTLFYYVKNFLSIEIWVFAYPFLIGEIWN